MPANADRSNNFGTKLNRLLKPTRSASRVDVDRPFCVFHSLGILQKDKNNVYLLEYIIN